MTRSGPTELNLRGVIIASVTAGPLFLLGMALSIWFDTPGAAISILIDSAFWGFAIAIGVVAIPIGTLVAVPANLIGTVVMTWLGDRNEGAQLPVIWALAGAAAIAVPAAIISGKSGQSPPDYVIAFVFTGACCALICRRGINWSARS